MSDQEKREERERTRFHKPEVEGHGAEETDADRPDEVREAVKENEPEEGEREAAGEAEPEAEGHGARWI